MVDLRRLLAPRVDRDRRWCPGRTGRASVPEARLRRSDLAGSPQAPRSGRRAVLPQPRRAAGRPGRGVPRRQPACDGRGDGARCARWAPAARCATDPALPSLGAADLQSELLDAAGDVPFLGPNCYGFVNTFDRVALWPDEHGMHPLDQGVAHRVAERQRRGQPHVPATRPAPRHDRLGRQPGQRRHGRLHRRVPR